MFTILSSFEYAYALARRLPKPRPGYRWYVCAHWPDARIKHIYQGPPDPKEA